MDNTLPTNEFKVPNELKSGQLPMLRASKFKGIHQSQLMRHSNEKSMEAEPPSNIQDFDILHKNSNFKNDKFSKDQSPETTCYCNRQYSNQHNLNKHLRAGCTMHNLCVDLRTIMNSWKQQSNLLNSEVAYQHLEQIISNHSPVFILKNQTEFTNQEDFTINETTTKAQTEPLTNLILDASQYIVDQNIDIEEDKSLLIQIAESVPQDAMLYQEQQVQQSMPLQYEQYLSNDRMQNIYQNFIDQQTQPFDQDRQRQLEASAPRIVKRQLKTENIHIQQILYSQPTNLILSNQTQGSFKFFKRQLVGGPLKNEDDLMIELSEVQNEVRNVTFIHQSDIQREQGQHNIKMNLHKISYLETLLEADQQSELLLQARLDKIVDNDNSYTDIANFKPHPYSHRCIGDIKSIHSGRCNLMVRSTACSKLCRLNESAYNMLQKIEAELSQVSNRQCQSQLEIYLLNKNISEELHNIQPYTYSLHSQKLVPNAVIENPHYKGQTKLFSEVKPRMKQLCVSEDQVKLSLAHQSIQRTLINEIIEKVRTHERTILDTVSQQEIISNEEAKELEIQLNDSQMPSLLKTIAMTREKLSGVRKFLDEFEGINEFAKLLDVSQTLLKDWREMIKYSRKMTVRDILTTIDMKQEFDNEIESKCLLIFETDLYLANKMRRATIKSFNEGDVLKAQLSYSSTMKLCEDITNAAWLLQDCSKVVQNIKSIDKQRAVQALLYDFESKISKTFKNLYDKVRYKRKLHFNKVSLRVRRLQDQIVVLQEQFTSQSNLFLAERIVETKVRDAVNHGNFEHIAEMLIKEKSLNRVRRHRKIMLILGEEYFKIHTLNFNAFILANSQNEVYDIIEGIELLSSPSLSKSSNEIIGEPQSICQSFVDNISEFNQLEEEEKQPDRIKASLSQTSIEIIDEPRPIGQTFVENISEFNQLEEEDKQPDKIIASKPKLKQSTLNFGKINSSNKQ